MIYVMLSRIQCLNQLFILEVLPEDKIKSFPEALEELKRMEKLDISKQDESYSSGLLMSNFSIRFNSSRASANDFILSSGRTSKMKS